MSSLVFMFLPDGTTKQRERRPYVPLPHGTYLYWDKKWYITFYGDNYVPMNLGDVPVHLQKQSRLLDLVMG